jgi:ubiquinol-cytochrome c reductase core subunit 2
MSVARSVASLSRSGVSPSVLTRSPIARRAFSTTTADSIPIAASADDGSKTAVVTVAIKAGPRFESQPGVAHVLKSFTFKSNAHRSALALVREAELYGGVLSTSLTKEHLLLTAEFLRGDE